MRYEDYAEFNDSLDVDGDVEIAAFKAPRSFVLYTMDRDAYAAALLEWRASALDEARARVAELHPFGDNKRRLEALVQQTKRGTIVPFVGAGATIPCGYPGWTAFLVEAGERAGEDRDGLRARLWKGEYEEVAELVIEKMGPLWFREHFRGVFGALVTLGGALPHIAKFARSFVLTTNFDRAVEQAFESGGLDFEDVVLGRHHGSIRKDLNEGRRVCFKLHGDVLREETRVLTLTEYNDAYGVPSVDFERPLPRNVRHVFTSRQLLFVGCSLNADRTLELFRSIVEKEPNKGGDLAQHFAILEVPKADKAGREKFLTERGIFPIWYPEGAHEYVEDVCRLLACEMTA